MLINLDVFYLLFIFLYIRFVVFVYRLVDQIDNIALRFVGEQFAIACYNFSIVFNIFLALSGLITSSSAVKPRTPYFSLLTHNRISKYGCPILNFMSGN